MSIVEHDRIGDDVFSNLKAPAKARYAIQCLPYLQTASKGFRAGETSVIGAFPKQGKTSLVDQLVLDLSREFSVLYLPLETGVADANLRMAAKIEKVPIEHIEKRGMEFDTRMELNARSLWVRAAQPGKMLSMDDIAKGVRHYKPQIVVIDHLRHIDGWMNDGRAPSIIAGQIRSLAASTGAHIIQAAQLKFEDFGKKPMAWRYQDSAAIAQLCSFEVLINRPYWGLGAKDNIAELVVRFSRYGPSGVVHVRWLGETQTFWHMPSDEFDMDFVECTCKARKAARKWRKKATA